MRVWASVILLGVSGAVAAPASLTSSTPATGTLAPGDVATYAVKAQSGNRLRLMVRQRRVDVAVRVIAPSGAVLGSVTNASHRTDPVTLTVITAESGAHRVEIQLEKPDSHPGAFRLSLDPVAPASDRDRQRMRAEALRNEGDLTADPKNPKSFQLAVAKYEESEATWRTLGDSLELASTLTRRADILAYTGQLPKAKSVLDEALSLWRRVGDEEGELDCLILLGTVMGHTGEPRQGLAFLHQALDMRRRLGPEPYGEGAILNNMAVAYGYLGDYAEAVKKYEEALPFAEQSGDPIAAASVRRNRATNLSYITRSDQAREELEQVKAKFHELGIPNEEGMAEYVIGNTYRHAREYREAVVHYQSALALLDRAGNGRFAAMTLQNVAIIAMNEHRWDDALRALDQAQEKVGDRDARIGAAIKVDRARVLVDRGESRAGVEGLIAARKDLKEVGYPAYEMALLTSLSKGELALGRLNDARGHILEAIALTEQLRSGIPGPTLRASYLEIEQQRYRLLVEVLMALHAREPTHGWDAAALGASETARARSLLEMIAEGRADTQLDVDPELRRAEQDIDARLDLKRKQQESLLARPHGPDAADALERDLEKLRIEREGVETRMRASSRAYASLTEPTPLSLEEIRTQTLDPSTALVEFLLGEDRSFVWVVTSTGITSATLPARKVIEKAALALHRTWSSPEGTDDGQAPARALSKMVLGPVAKALSSNRLLIAADGALQLIPFAALQDVRTGRALIERHEVEAVPSASVLAMLRGRRTAPTGAGATVAILADPVFTLHDARIRGVESTAVASRSTDLERSLEDTGLRSLEPLPATRDEAAAIESHAGQGRTFTALGFQASRAVALGPQVASARIVHLASHALTDARRPELSGIVLSLFDEQGRPQDGFLGMADIYRLRLSADLVVLSACRTGLGKEVRGEGVLGLTRGFLFAGTPRVVASVWKVSDRATAALMDRFYASLLEQHLSPGAALREAQLALRKERRFSSPFAWAGFVLHGDWAPMPGATGAAREDAHLVNDVER